MGFILLFPGFLFYQSFLALNLVSDLLNGYYGNIALGLIIIYSIIFPFSNLRYTRDGYIKSVQYFFLYILCWSLANHMFRNFDYEQEIGLQMAQYFILYLVLFNIGYYVDFKDKWLLKISNFSIGIVFVLIVALFLRTGSYYLALDRFFDSESNLSSHQSLARSFVMIAFLSFFYTTKIERRLLFFLMSSIILFVLGARSEFYGFVLILGLYFLLKLPRIGFLSGLLIVAVAISSSGELVRGINSRQLNVTSLENDRSWNVRGYLRDVAINTISESPIIGDYGSHAKLGTVAHYSHNVLSVYVAFGLLGFICFIWLVVTPIVKLLKFKYRSVDQDFILFFGIYILLLIILSKSFFWELPGFLWGFSKRENLQ